MVARITVCQCQINQSDPENDCLNTAIRSASCSPHDKENKHWAYFRKIRKQPQEMFEERSAKCCFSKKKS